VPAPARMSVRPSSADQPLLLALAGAAIMRALELPHEWGDGMERTEGDRDDGSVRRLGGRGACTPWCVAYACVYLSTLLEARGGQRA
jgi:hypothetical protein